MSYGWCPGCGKLVKIDPRTNLCAKCNEDQIEPNDNDGNLLFDDSEAE